MVIDADQLARSLLMPGKPAYQAVIAKFGTHILTKDGELDRPQLHQRIFSDHELKLWLEHLLHPAIRRMMADRIKLCDRDYCLLVIPLLIENLPHPLVNRILLVDVDPPLQCRRVSARDHMSAEQVSAVIATQANRQQRLQHADDIIDNRGDFAALQQQVAQLHKKYLEQAKNYRD